VINHIGLRCRKEENDALAKVEHGLRMDDAAKIAWGAAELLRLQEQMTTEPLGRGDSR